MSSRVILLIRRSTDYYLENKLTMPSCEGRENRPPWNEYRLTTLNAIGWWNELFKIPYMAFRKRVRQIPAQLVADSQFDMVLNHFDWQAIEQFRRFRNTWVVPLDEDDWPDPQLPEILRKVSIGKFDGVFWNAYRICDCNSNFITCDQEYYKNSALLSNAYAVRADAPADVLVGHVRAQRYLTNAHLNVRHLPWPLTVKVDSPSSMSLLRAVESKAHLKDLVDRFKNKNLTLPSEYQGPYRQYQKLIDAL